MYCVRGGTRPASPQGQALPPQKYYRAATVLLLLVLAASALATLMVVPSPTQAVSGTPGTPSLSDNFTRDTSLNGSLWLLNGSVGSAVGLDDAGFTVVPLQPAFSSAGMEISQVNQSEEVGTIQSLESFAPPFTATAVVEGTISNGHTFGFAVSSTNATSGVLVYGNLNSTNCSNLGNCGDPTTCGNSANSAIPPNQCYYGIDAKVGQGGGSWKHVAKLYLTPGVNVIYTVQISVDATGGAVFSVSQGGQLLGQSSSQVGAGPFYIILEQGEGAPVARPGPNQAFWMSVSVGAFNTSSSTTSVLPAPTTTGLTTIDWAIIIIIIVLLLFVILFWYSRRRTLTITVLDSSQRSPIRGASVWAEGPKNLSGLTERDGEARFGKVKGGDYTVKADATGYAPSVPVKIPVEGKAEYTILLARTGEMTETSPGRPQAHEGGVGPKDVIRPSAQITGGAVDEPFGPAQAPGQQVKGSGSAASGPEQMDLPELQGWGGDRIRQVIATFQAKGAISPETAMTAKELGLSRIFVRIMERRRGRTRVFVEVNGKYYLDQKALQEMSGQ